MSHDDRAGITAFLLALEEIDPDKLSRRVIFAWTIGEEVGLAGAHALADYYGPTIRTAYAVDTFVSSDSPLESPRFAYALLGKGPVFRGLDGASVSKPVEMARIGEAARKAGSLRRRDRRGGLHALRRALRRAGLARPAKPLSRRGAGPWRSAKPGPPHRRRRYILIRGPHGIAGAGLDRAAENCGPRGASI